MTTLFIVSEVTGMDGILPLWKPKGMTSHDCVMRIRRLYQTKKVGHTGTLDPEVEGVLPICIGEATKVVPFLTDTLKTYTAKVKLGATTETEDSYGKVLESKDIQQFPTKSEIDKVLHSFLGESIQIPPMYSAVKVKGKRLYEYARANEPVERPERRIHIYSISRLKVSEEEDAIGFEVTCSKGTYIRTLCVDIGKKLNFPAHMSFLERTKTGIFTKEESVTFETIEEKRNDTERYDLLHPIASGVSHLSRLDVNEEIRVKVSYGQKLPIPSDLPKTNPFVLMNNNQLLAIYKIHDNKQEIKPVRVFNAKEKVGD